MNPYFFDPRDFGARGRHRPELEFKIWRSKGLTPWFYVVFVWIFRWKSLESQNSKRMTVYEQITFFINNQNFSICFWIENRCIDWKFDFSVKAIYKKNWQKLNLETFIFIDGFQSRPFKGTCGGADWRVDLAHVRMFITDERCYGYHISEIYKSYKKGYLTKSKGL